MSQGAVQNPMSPVQMEPLLAKAIAGIDAALLQVGGGQPARPPQLVEYGAGLRETQVKKAMTDLEKMEDMFFEDRAQGGGRWLQSAAGRRGAGLEKMQFKGSGTGAHATQTVEQLTDQAQVRCAKAARWA